MRYFNGEHRKNNLISVFMIFQNNRDIERGLHFSIKSTQLLEHSNTERCYECMSFNRLDQRATTTGRLLVSNLEIALSVSQGHRDALPDGESNRG